MGSYQFESLMLKKLINSNTLDNWHKIKIQFEKFEKVSEFRFEILFYNTLTKQAMNRYRGGNQSIRDILTWRTVMTYLSYSLSKFQLACYKSKYFTVRCSYVIFILFYANVHSNISYRLQKVHFTSIKTLKSFSRRVYSRTFLLFMIYHGS